MFSARRITAALVIGALGCLSIWVAVPYNNFYLNNSFISDLFFPVAGVVYLLGLVLGVNLLLHILCPRQILNRTQLALIFAMLVAASILPSQGLLRMLPWSLAQATQDISQSRRLSVAVEQAGIQHALFPDAIGYEVETPASSQLLDELEPGQTIPWANWLRLLLPWGVFLLSCWLVMVGVGLVLLPEWRDRERLPFPLLTVYRSLLPDTESGELLPAAFRDRLFWLGAGSVMLLYALNGLNLHTHGAVPGFPLGWDLRPVFAEVPWRYMPTIIKQMPHIFFVLVGMAYFMPNRVGFSIWFTTVAYAVYEMIRAAYFPTAYSGATTDHHNGAMIAISLTTLYLSRHHWQRVGTLLFQRVQSDADRLLKEAGWMLVAGAVGMFVWLRWAGVSSIWAGVFVLIGFMVTLLIARIVAETGMPFARITGLEPSYFMGLLPAGWLTGVAIYMAGFISLIFQYGSRVSAAVMVSHAAEIDPDATPRQQLRIGYMTIAILAITLVVGGAIHLHMGYRYSMAVDGTVLNAWGRTVMNGTQNELVRWVDGVSSPPPAAQIAHLGFGIVLAAGLQVACMFIPQWPLHPIGLLLVGNFYARMGWASVMIGWLIKILLVHYGGAAVYRRIQPVFLGLILGEIFSAVIWTLVPVILMWLGNDPTSIGHMPILPQ